MHLCFLCSLTHSIIPPKDLSVAHWIPVVTLGGGWGTCQRAWQAPEGAQP